MQSLPSEGKRNQRRSPLTASRVSKRIKKAKVPFDPSILTLRQRKPKPCFHCKKTDQSELLICCKGKCGSRVNLTCHNRKMEFERKRTGNVTRATTRNIAHQSGIADAIVQNSDSVQIEKLPPSNYANSCSRRNTRSDTYIIRKPVNSDDTNIPDASQWSIEQVFRYFQVKFPDYAHVFQEHQIDGKSLYQLQRRDIVEVLMIKLGPALHIYADIMKLQTKHNPTL